MNKKFIRKYLEKIQHLSATRLMNDPDIVYDTDAFEQISSLAQRIIKELDKPVYYPLGQEPVNQQCLSCGLNCPNDCPLDK